MIQCTNPFKRVNKVLKERKMEFIHERSIYFSYHYYRCVYAHEMHAVVNETEELQFVLFSGEHTSTFETFACFSFFINERERKICRKIETDTNFLEKDNIKNSSFKRNFMPDENLLL